MSICAIGDIHGHSRELALLLKQIPEDMPLILLGDYIDRGPDSVGVLRMVRELVFSGRAEALFGNHEDMMLRALLGDAEWMDVWLDPGNGGLDTVRSVCGCGECADMPPDCEDKVRYFMLGEMGILFSSMKQYLRNEHALFVHAGLVPGVPLEKQEDFDRDENPLLWVRKPFLKASAEDFKEYPLIVHGHTWRGKDAERMRLRADGTPWRINLDGGIYRPGGELLAMILPEMRMLSVPAMEY